MDKVYLQEAFKALDILNEEDFNLSSTEDMKDLKDFIETDDEISFEEVIDPEAETEEELKDSYLGNVILDCCVCHSKIYKAPDEVEVDEETELANIDEECPFCFSLDGYKIIGQVAPFGETVDSEDEVEEEPEETEVQEESEEDIIEEAMKGNLCPVCGKEPCECSLNENINKPSGKKNVREHFEKVEIETEDQKMEMTSDEDGKTVVVTEPKEEVVGPVSDEVQDEIEINSINSEEEKEQDSEEEVDVDIEDFSEEEFNELGEAYLKKVYENVNSFKTSLAKMENGKLLIEGIIGFTSGKQKKTSFLFEGKDITKNNNLRFVGENLQLSKGKKSFTLRGNLSEGKFIAESLNYNYRTKDSNGNSTRLYGTVKLSEAKADLPIQKLLKNAKIDLDSDPKKGIEKAIELIKNSDTVSDKDKKAFENNLSSGNLSKKLSTLAAYMTGIAVGK